MKRALGLTIGLAACGGAPINPPAHPHQQLWRDAERSEAEKDINDGKESALHLASHCKGLVERAINHGEGEIIATPDGFMLKGAEVTLVGFLHGTCHVKVDGTGTRLIYTRPNGYTDEYANGTHTDELTVPKIPGKEISLQHAVAPCGAKASCGKEYTITDKPTQLLIRTDVDELNSDLEDTENK